MNRREEVTPSPLHPATGPPLATSDTPSLVYPTGLHSTYVQKHYSPRLATDLRVTPSPTGSVLPVKPPPRLHHRPLAGMVKVRGVSAPRPPTIKRPQGGTSVGRRGPGRAPTTLGRAISITSTPTPSSTLCSALPVLPSVSPGGEGPSSLTGGRSRCKVGRGREGGVLGGLDLSFSHGR